jgi:hypothetical protein
LLKSKYSSRFIIPSSALKSIHLLSIKTCQYPSSGLGSIFSHIAFRTKFPDESISPYFVEPSVVIENIAVLSKKSDKISKFVGRDFSIFSSKSIILQFPNFTDSTFPE